MKNAVEKYLTLKDPFKKYDYFQRCLEMSEDDLRVKTIKYLVNPDNKGIKYADFLRLYCAKHLEKYGKKFIVN